MTVKFPRPLFLGLLVAAVAPLLWVQNPPLVDYPDHLARMQVLADRGRDPLLARFYEIQWALLPNLAFDLVVPPLARIWDVFAAGRLYLVALVALLCGGVLAVQRALFGRAQATAFVAFLLVYNYAFLQGLVNYVTGVALVLWALATWIALRGRGAVLRAAVSSGWVALLFLCHLSAVGLYGLALLCHEGWWLVIRNSPSPGAACGGLAARSTLAERPPLHAPRVGNTGGRLEWRHLAVEAAVFGLPFLVAVPMLLASPTTGLAGDTLFSLGDKLEGLGWVVLLYDDTWDSLWAGAAGLLLAWAAWRHRLRLHPVGWSLLGGGAVVFMAMPNVLLGAWGADVRLPVGLAFLLAPFLRAEFRGGGQGRFLVVLALLALVRFAGVAWVWQGLDGDLREIRRSFQSFAPGSRVLVAEADRPDGTFAMNRALSHAVCLAMIERSAFVADAFAEPGKQVMAVRPEYARQSNIQDGDEPAVGELVRALRHPDPLADEYWGQWWTRFDVVYVLYTGGAEPVVPDLLKPLARGRRFRAYRVTMDGRPAVP